MCEKRGGANTQISVLFGMTCLHDSSNFDFTPTGQKGELEKLRCVKKIPLCNLW